MDSSDKKLIKDTTISPPYAYYFVIIVICGAVTVYISLHVYHPEVFIHRNPIWLFIVYIQSSMLLYVLFLAHTTEPGFVDINWTMSNTTQSLERKENGSLRWCNKTKLWKPDRSHYCSELNR